MITLLQGHSLTAGGFFKPEKMQLNLTERGSTATMTVGPSAPELAVGDWLRDENGPGAGIIWRVKTVDTQYDSDTRTIQLEHLINTLKDRIMFGEVKPSDISGGSTATARETVAYILARQSDWALGDFTYEVSNPYNFNGDDLMSAIETVSSSLEGCWWSYDFSEYPFKLNITQRAGAVSTELRMSRNIQTAKMTIDRSRMYTRLYPIGKNNLHIDGNYVSRNEEIYGVICKVETDQSKSSKAELQRWAEERIRNHCEPAVTVTVNALDMSEETGEDLDRIVLGAVCRMPLPGYDTIIEETVTRISWPDKIAEPERATVTLANIQEDVASIVNNLIKGGGGGGRASALNAEEDHAWFVDTTTHVAMVAEACAGEGAASDWSRVAALVVDGNGIHQRVTQAQQDIVTAYSLIDQTTTAIRIEIGDVASQVRSFIEQTPEMIHAEVGSAVSGFAQSVIEQTATYIRTEVSNAASAISESVIEQTTEYIRTEVSAVASGVAWSVVMQTMTGIEQRIGNKSKIYVQMTDPNDGVNELHEGDVWIKSDANKTWNDNAGNTWNSQAATQWRQKYGDQHYVWRNGAWQLTNDTSTAVENEVALEQTKSSLALVGRKVDLQGEIYDSRLEVTAQSIRSEVSTAGSNLYSAIQQTATNISMKVADVKEGLQSSIDVQANKIALVVKGTDNNPQIDAASIVLGINSQTGSYVKIQAQTINLSGYVTANQLSAANARIDNLVSGSTLASLIRVNRFQASNISLSGHAHHNSNITIEGITYNIVTWN